MNELNERDWELVNAYHDGELDDAERGAFKSRLKVEPALEEALNEVASISSSLSALRPEMQQFSSTTPKRVANQNKHPARWLVGGTLAAAVVFAVVVGSQFFRTPSAFEIHADFAAQPFTVVSKDIRHATVTQSRTVPDLGVANLVEVATRDLNGSHITHYAGVNGCRLTYFRGKFSPGEQSPSFQVQVAEWSTSNNVRHMIMATGMDQNKFNAIATFLELTTRQQESEEVLASLTEATASAVRCVS